MILKNQKNLSYILSSLISSHAFSQTAKKFDKISYFIWCLLCKIQINWEIYSYFCGHLRIPGLYFLKVQFELVHHLQNLQIHSMSPCAPSTTDPPGSLQSCIPHSHFSIPHSPFFHSSFPNPHSQYPLSHPANPLTKPLFNDSAAGFCLLAHICYSA